MGLGMWINPFVYKWAGSFGYKWANRITRGMLPCLIRSAGSDTHPTLFPRGLITVPIFVPQGPTPLPIFSTGSDTPPNFFCRVWYPVLICSVGYQTSLEISKPHKIMSKSFYSLPFPLKDKFFKMFSTYKLYYPMHRWNIQKESFSLNFVFYWYQTLHNNIKLEYCSG